jgi:hypothetical protein
MKRITVAEYMDANPLAPLAAPPKDALKLDPAKTIAPQPARTATYADWRMLTKMDAVFNAEYCPRLWKLDLTFVVMLLQIRYLTVTKAFV